MSENNEKENQLKSVKDIKSVEDLDLDKLELIRGQTPPDIKQQCLKLCRDYLSGNWSQQTVDTIEVKRITGGVMNQLYSCAISEPDSSCGVPQEVAIRLYGKNLFESTDKERVRDLVVSVSFSENGLGPKLYGICERAQILKFYKHRNFKVEEQKNPKLVEQVFQTMAKIHAMDVPIKRTHDWMYDLMVKQFADIFRKHPINDFIKQYDCKTLSEDKLRAEINWVREAIKGADSPVVFTHSDYKSYNLMVTEPDDELIVCDFDVTQYGYRGQDFVGLVQEWGRSKFESKPIEGLPLTDSQLKPLIEIYVKESHRIHGKSYSENPINSVEHIIREVKIFLMFSHIFGSVYVLSYEEDDPDFPVDRKLTMEMSDLALKNYYTLKRILMEQGIVKQGDKSA